MSKVIKSNRVNISGGTYRLSSDVFISKEDYFADSKTSAQASSDLDSASDEYTPKTLIEQAEAAAIEIMDNAQAAADGLIEDARKSARQLEEEAIGNANEVYENSKNRGREDGFKEGYEEGRLKAELLIQEALDIKREIHIKNEEFLLDKEAEIIKMVLAIARKVIGKEVEDIEYIEALASAAMEHLSYATSIVLRVSEKDYDAATFVKPKIMAMAERIEELEIKADYALSPGSCVIDTVSGSIDASVQTQLDRIEDIFNNILASKEDV